MSWGRLVWPDADASAMLSGDQFSVAMYAGRRTKMSPPGSRMTLDKNVRSAKGGAWVLFTALLLNDG